MMYKLHEDIEVRDAISGVWHPTTVLGCTCYRIQIEGDTKHKDVSTSQLRASSTATAFLDARVSALEAGTRVEVFSRGWQPATIIDGLLYLTSNGTSSLDSMRRRTQALPRPPASSSLDNSSPGAKFNRAEPPNPLAGMNWLHPFVNHSYQNT
jgi:hypothetical protein